MTKPTTNPEEERLLSTAEGAYEAWQDAEAALRDMREIGAPSTAFASTEEWRDYCKRVYEEKKEG